MKFQAITKFLKSILLSLLTLSLISCSGESDKDNSHIQTQLINLDINLPPDSQLPDIQFHPNLPESYNVSINRTIYDSALHPHELQMYFIKRAINESTLPNSWYLAVQIDDQNVADPTNSLNDYAAFYSIIFDENGRLNTHLSDEILISNWTPISNVNVLGPITREEGAVVPVTYPPTSSNFEIDITNITQLGSANRQTTNVSINLTLPAASPVPTLDFDPNNSSSYTLKHSTQIVDSLLLEHELDLYFLRTTDELMWQVIVKIDNRDVGDPIIGSDPTTKILSLIFNDQNNFDSSASSNGLISNWTPVNSEGIQNGAMGPLNEVNGGVLPIPDPITSSNFEIHFLQLRISD